ncbi:F0F1 ATP synthase subunit A [Microbacterium sp. ZW T5_56]|uniref:F0F1 ATP synthase subunit A n=1 Tax=Microbacterium sp. ZW T5_56 TaxID=3378081 RepID=UPI003853F620
MIHAASLIAAAASSEDEDGFHAPSIWEFFPDIVLFEGTPFAINRIHLIQILVTVVLVLILWLGTRKMKLIPGRGQSIVEMGFDFVRVNIAHDLLGRKDGNRFLPILTTLFFMILFMNLTGVIPGLNLAGTSIIAMPLLLAVVAYVTFIYAGLKKSPKGFIKNSLFPSGVPWPIYFLVTPLEFISTFIIRPVTLTLRLLMNMMVGHLMLVLFFSATWFFFFHAGGFFPILGVGTLAAGFAYTIFELLVAFLQAYVFTILTAVYIQLAVADEH